MSGNIVPSGSRALDAVDVQPSAVAFVFEGHNIRSISTNGRAEFAAKDILEVLELAGNPAEHVRHLPAQHRRVLKKADMSMIQNHALIPAGSRANSATLITREGVTLLALRSDKPAARRFQEWLVAMSESVDDHGGYIRGQENASPELQAKAQEFTRRVAGLIAAEEREARSEAFAFLKGRR